VKKPDKDDRPKVRLAAASPALSRDKKEEEAHLRVAKKRVEVAKKK
jgi:hypothetical protein